ncbi:MAG: GNAT family N-acetyltransferase [Bryobacteraceae bacterium]
MPPIQPASLAVCSCQLNDLQAVAGIHMKAFAARPMSALGRDAVRRYYHWLMDEVHTEAYRITAVDSDDGKVLGFCFAGRYEGATAGFLAKNRGFLMLKVVERPWLVFNNSLLRSRVVSAVKTLRTTSRTADRPPTPEWLAARAALRNSFGVLAIGVHPAHQGKGIGKLLMANVEAEARRRGRQRMHLSVDIDNARAIGFYQRLGWVKSPPADGGPWRGSMTKQLGDARESPPPR